MWFFSNGFLSDPFLLSKTFRSLKGGTKCCSVCMVSCVAYSFLIWCADCLCNWFSLEQTLNDAFSTSVLWSLSLSQLWIKQPWLNKRFAWLPPSRLRQLWRREAEPWSDAEWRLLHLRQMKSFTEPIVDQTALAKQKICLTPHLQTPATLATSSWTVIRRWTTPSPPRTSSTRRIEHLQTNRQPNNEKQPTVPFFFFDHANSASNNLAKTKTKICLTPLQARSRDWRRTTPSPPCASSTRILAKNI